MTFLCLQNLHHSRTWIIKCMLLMLVVGCFAYSLLSNQQYVTGKQCTGKKSEKILTFSSKIGKIFSKCQFFIQIDWWSLAKIRENFDIFSKNLEKFYQIVCGPCRFHLNKYHVIIQGIDLRHTNTLLYF